MGVLRTVRVVCMANILLITVYNNLQEADQLKLAEQIVSLAECCNTSKENGNGADDGEGALHARIQAGDGVAGRGQPEHRSGDADRP